MRWAVNWEKGHVSASPIRTLSINGIESLRTIRRNDSNDVVHDFFLVLFIFISTRYMLVPCLVWFIMLLRFVTGQNVLRQKIPQLILSVRVNFLSLSMPLISIQWVYTETKANHLDDIFQPLPFVAWLLPVDFKAMRMNLSFSILTELD